MITVEDLQSICPLTKAERLALFVGPLNRTLTEFDIDSTPDRETMFLAQIAHESAAFTKTEENLNYGAEGLHATWPKRFTLLEAADYARQPERIANRVYALRMGNGDEASGDGWRYRGAGLIQTTGKANHEAVAKYFEIAPELVGDWLRQPEGAARSAGLFWMQNDCNRLADAGDFAGVTRRINGGVAGYADRMAYLNRAQRVLA